MPFPRLLWNEIHSQPTVLPSNVEYFIWQQQPLTIWSGGNGISLNSATDYMVIILREQEKS